MRVGRNAPTLYAWGEALADSYGRLHDTICVTDANGSALLIRRVCACEESLQVLALDAAMNLIFASLSLRMEGHAAVAVCVDAGWYEAAGIDGTRRAVLEPINRDALERRLGLKVLPVRAFANVARAALVAARARDDGGQPELVDVPLAAIKRTIAPVARVHHAPRGAKATPAVTFKRHHAIQAAAAC
ncbi:MAG TPA: hypothetical protein VFQ88_07720 [Nevskiaceae bacterium]|nr:hypothetical protein [Nevskiaceae bacterium]